MRPLALGLLLLAAPARSAEEWMFAFGNGDRVRGGFTGMRNGTVLVAVPASPRAVAVPVGEIARAEPTSGPEDASPPSAQLLRLRDGGALLGRCRAIRQGKVEFEVESLGRLTIPARDVAEVLAAEDAVRAYHRSMVRPPGDPGATQPPERLDALWSYLGRADANVAWEAHRDLVRAGDTAVLFLDERLRVQPDAPAIVDGWIRSLDADSTEVRLRAHARLRSLGPAAERQLRAATRKAIPAESQQRIATLLTELASVDPAAAPATDPEILRYLRAIRVLEEIATPGAQAVLERLANAAPDAPTGHEAQAALERTRRAQ